LPWLPWLGLALVAGLVCAESVRIGLALGGAAALGAVGFLCATDSGIRVLAVALVASTFVTRFKFAAGGVHFRPEDFLALAGLVAVVSRTGSGNSTVRHALSHSTVRYLGLYVLWSVLGSLLFSPSALSSLKICGWLVLDLIILVVVVTAFSSEAIEDTATKCAVFAFIAAGVLYVVGTHIGFGVQLAQSTSYGTKSAYGLSYEANILGSTAAIWVFLGVTRGNTRLISDRWRTLLVATGLVALILSYTRAAVAGLVLALLVWAMVAGYGATTTLVRRLGAFLVLIAIVLALVPSVGGPVYKKLSQVTNLASPTGVTRVGTTKKALSDLDHGGWLFGLGLNSYGQRHLDPTRPNQDIAGYIGAFPIEVLYDGGVIGLGLLVAALLATKPWRSRRPARAAGALVVFLVGSLATSPFWLGSTWVLIALAIASDVHGSSPERGATPAAR
jgi:hypothetical protein